ncbi:MAG TPA: 4-alpha-glucanotransferase, partial [Clostridia bacterium]|nr:4-alpha-glucanotransferase [Clostridia bacterium]
MHAILNLESHRHRTVLAGENLGTVPPEVNTAMDRHHLRKMYVVQFEMRPDRRKALPPAPPRCVASLNTHDTPTFAGFWNAADAEEKAALGLIPVRTLPRERRERTRLVRALAAYLRAGGYLTGEDADRAATFEACLKWLGDSPAEFILVNLEDVWGETQPQNVPGTSSERPNWRRKARLAVEEIIGPEALQHWLRALTAPGNARQRPGRVSQYSTTVRS